MPEKRRHPATLAYTLYGVAAVIVWLVLYVTVSIGVDWHFYAVWLLTWNLTALVFYCLDKLLPKLNLLRVPEVELLLLAAVGGVFGGWVCMALWGHKKRKRWFWVVFVLSTLVHLGFCFLVFFAP